MSGGAVREDRALTASILTALTLSALNLTAMIDFLMPEKTHKGSCRAAASFLFCSCQSRSNCAGGK